MLKIKINNGGKIRIKDFRNFQAVSGEKDATTAAKGLIVNAIASSILRDIDAADAFGDFVVLYKETAEDVVRMNNVLKSDYNLSQELVLSPYFTNSSILESDDTNIVTTINAVKAVKLHAEHAKEAVKKYCLANIWHKGITVLYCCGGTDIILPTAAVLTAFRVDDFEEIYIEDENENNPEYYHLSNYGNESIIAAYWLAKAAGLDEFIPEEFKDDSITIYTNLKKAIAKAMLGTRKNN